MTSPFPALQLRELYQPRPIRFLELWQEAGWQIKLYGIAYRRPQPRAELIAAAKKLFKPHLSQPAAATHYHTGFIGVHEGRGANFAFFSFWAEENELHHHVYVSPAAELERWEYVTPTGLIACVWDMRVLSFERDAWVATVLANPAGPNLAHYLERRLHEDI